MDIVVAAKLDIAVAADIADRVAAALDIATAPDSREDPADMAAVEAPVGTAPKPGDPGSAE